MNADARDEITALADKIKNGLTDNGEFVPKFVALAKRMQSVSGKKVYGYLPKSVKAMVNELVDLLEKDEDINRIYELWYQAKCAVFATYTDNPSPRKPLSQEEAFKPLRNAMIRTDYWFSLICSFKSSVSLSSVCQTMKNARQPLILTCSVKIVNRRRRRTNGKDAVKRTPKVHHDDAQQSVRIRYGRRQVTK